MLRQPLLGNPRDVALQAQRDGTNATHFPAPLLYKAAPIIRRTGRTRFKQPEAHIYSNGRFNKSDESNSCRTIFYIEAIED